MTDESGHAMDEESLQRAITPTLERWRTGVGTGDLDLVASAFTPDALFQGSRPHPLFGREGVKDYYAPQPRPLTVDYDVVHLRPLGTTAVIAYLRATFHAADGADRRTWLTLVLESADGDWLIDHYHVSRVV